MIEYILWAELSILGLIIFLLSIHHDLQPDLEEEMGKVKSIQDTMKEMKEKMDAQLRNK